MAKFQSLQVMLTKAEVAALIMAITEYIYLIEEGDVEELMEEMEVARTDAPLTADEACNLKAQLEALL
jgi:hypothetical protein